MNARLQLSFLLVLALVGGTALKVMATQAAGVDTTTPVISAAEAFLKKRGLTVVGTDTTLDLTMIGAEGPDGCRLILANAAPQGWHEGILRRLAEGYDSLFFVFEGGLSPEQPALRTRIQHYMSVLQRHLGLPAAIHPLLAVIATKSCRADTYPWAELSAVPLPTS